MVICTHEYLSDQFLFDKHNQTRSILLHIKQRGITDEIFTLAPLLGIFALAPDVLLAEVELKEAFPVNGSVIREAPPQLELSFTEEVQLLKLAVSGIETKMIPTSFKPSTTAQTHFSIPLPGLDEDAYVVTWTVLGKDGREVQDKLTFIVDVDAAERSGSTDTSHSQHRE